MCRMEFRRIAKMASTSGIDYGSEDENSTDGATTPCRPDSKCRAHRVSIRRSVGFADGSRDHIASTW